MPSQTGGHVVHWRGLNRVADISKMESSSSRPQTRSLSRLASISISGPESTWCSSSAEAASPLVDDNATSETKEDEEKEDDNKSDEEEDEESDTDEELSFYRADAAFILAHFFTCMTDDEADEMASSLKLPSKPVNFDAMREFDNVPAFIEWLKYEF
jgi:hypothetical protein